MKMLFRLAVFTFAVLTLHLPLQSQGWQHLWGTLPQFNSVSAVNDSTCWYAGSRTFVALVTNHNVINWRDMGLELGQMTAIHGRSDQLAWTASSDGKIYRTTNGGALWVKQYQHPAGPAAFFNGIHFWDDNTGIAWGDPVSYPSAGPFLVMRTTDGGSNWNEITSGIPSVSGLFGYTDRHDEANGYFWFATASSGDSTIPRYLYRSRTQGLTWDTLRIPQNFGDFAPSFSDSLNGLLTGNDGKIARTTDGGASWNVRYDGVGYSPLKFQDETGNVWVQGYFDNALGYRPIFRSTDYGTTWSQQLRSSPISAIAFSVVNGNNVWAGGFNYLILRTTTGGIPTSVGSGEGISAVPMTMELNQNYPNPFNPTTMIKYRLSESGHTRLVIYDMLGRPVRTLVDETARAGWHLVAWDGLDESRQGVSTGTYFYRVEQSGRALTKKMLFLK